MGRRFLRLLDLRLPLGRREECHERGRDARGTECFQSSTAFASVAGQIQPSLLPRHPRSMVAVWTGRGMAQAGRIVSGWAGAAV
jgi:hypothetical protein